MKPILVDSKTTDKAVYTVVSIPGIDVALPIIHALIEMDAQDNKWGENRVMSGHLWNTILTEEVGEVAKAVLECDKNNLRDELVQAAAVALNMIKALDRDEVSLGY